MAKLDCELSIGIDSSLNAITIGKNEAKRQDLSNVLFSCADVQFLPFKNDSIDIVISSDLIEHLYDNELSLMFSEVSRILKKDGFCVIQTYPHKYRYLFTRLVYQIIILPMILLPNGMKKKGFRYVDLLIQTGKEMKRKILKRKKYRFSHCNCQSLETIMRLIEARDLNIIRYFSENTYSTYEKPAYLLLLYKLFNNFEYTKDNMYIIFKK